jgi:phenol 2-monooxygenase
MQYHLNGFRPGDPRVAETGSVAPGQREVDVLIVGCGPAGLTLAAQLCAFPDISTKIVERKSGPLTFGQADGIACRSMEMFQAFGFAEEVARESYWVNEVTFWRPRDDGSGLARADRIQDVEDGLSEMPHVTLSQARVHDFYLDLMAKSQTGLVPNYNRELTELVRGEGEFPLIATLACLDEPGAAETIRARYVVGCDGARSKVRQSMGLALKGESARQLWGVMDVLAVTDFPDIRLKCAIQSAGQGSILIIPREGGYLVRLYIELDELAGDERAADRSITADALVSKAQAIMAPYHLTVKEIAWWSAYEIGQRVCERFDDGDNGHDGDVRKVPRIFIAGDACHTHSPKAGQGMNVSMADAFNLGWKLANVIRGHATPDLLATYSLERHAKAQELIDFDRDMARLFSQKPKSPEEADQFQRYFRKHGRYTAGVETRYDPSLITLDGSHQHLAQGFKIGARFHSAPVIRAADAKRVELGHCLVADGRWRLMVFAPNGDIGMTALVKLCTFLQTDQESPLHNLGPNKDIDAEIDVRAVLQSSHGDIDLGALPELLLPRKGRYGLIDYEKVFCPDMKTGPDIFDHRGIDRSTGAVVIVRPDQFVAGILMLDDTEKLARFFKRIAQDHAPRSASAVD